MSESEISWEGDDLSDNIAQLQAENPRNECESQTNDVLAGKETPHKSTKQEDDLLAEIAGGFTQHTYVSPDINLKLADISVSKKFTGEKVKEQLEKYPYWNIVKAIKCSFLHWSSSARFLHDNISFKTIFSLLRLNFTTCDSQFLNL